MESHIKAEEVNGKEGRLGLITLKRPEALNALSYGMVQVIDNYLREWEVNEAVKAVVIRGTGEKAFCAGGDIKQVYLENQSNNPHIYRFFWNEYRLNHRIHNYSKPYIAFMNGITMGGGLGISVHGSHRIGTEKSVLAMPETKIGFFPDVGSSYFLPRCPGFIGFYLGLTGTKLTVDEAHSIKLIDNIVPSEQLDNLLQCLVDIEIPTHNGHHIISDCMEHFTKTMTSNDSALMTNKQHIDHCFSATTMLNIINRLQQLDNEWSRKTLEELMARSPTSLAITLKQLHEGKHLDFDNCMKMEYRLATRFLQGHDLFEGVRAVLIDKDNQPSWKPAHINEISEANVEKYFEPLEEDLRFN